MVALYSTVLFSTATSRNYVREGGGESAAVATDENLITVLTLNNFFLKVNEKLRFTVWDKVVRI